MENVAVIKTVDTKFCLCTLCQLLKIEFCIKLIKA